MEKTYIPSNWVQDFIDGKEQHNNASCQFTHQQLWKNERGKLFYPHWDSYLECSKVLTIEHKSAYSVLESFFKKNPTFLCNIRFRHNLIFFELLTCKYNCDFGPKDRTSNLLALIEDMGFRKKLLDKWGKTIQKGKPKAHIIIETNGGSQNKVANVFYHQNIISSPFNLLLQKRSTSMRQEVFAMGTSSKGTKWHLLHMFL
jgi:hypothetical protein